MSNLDGLKILVVDDERFIRTTIRAVLRAVGHFDVAEADDGDVALAEVERFKPDIVLCDIAMPRMGGLRFVEMLRKNTEAATRDTPVVILSGHNDQPTVIAASKLRIDGYLIKPISPKQLGDQLRKIVSRREAMPLA